METIMNDKEQPEPARFKKLIKRNGKLFMLLEGETAFYELEVNDEVADMFRDLKTLMDFYSKEKH